MAHKPAICTMSLGRCFAGHSLPHKLDMAAKYGFRGIEVFYEDLVDLAASFPGGKTPENQLAAAGVIRDLCLERNLEIMCLQPFMHYGGRVDRKEHQKQLDEIRLGMRLARVLGTDLLCLPSSFLTPEEVTEDMDRIVEDMITVADLALQQSPVIRIAYEALCWGTRIDTWEASWDLVQRVDRPNFGLAIDTFNLAGRVYADPTSITGRNENCEQELMASLTSLVADVDVNKVFLLQVADAERLSSPLTEGHPFHVASQPSRMSWSRNCRLFYGETQHGAYLPIRTVLAAMINGLGFKGYLSFEVFNRRLADPGQGIPEEMAKRASVAFDKMVKDVPLRIEGAPQGPQREAPQERVAAML